MAGEDFPEQTVPKLNAEEYVRQVKGEVHPGRGCRACKKTMEGKRACMFDQLL